MRSIKDFRINVFTAEGDIILFLTSGGGQMEAVVLDPPPPLLGDHAGEDGGQDFLPMDQHSMEVETQDEHQEHVEHVERQQVRLNLTWLGVLVVGLKARSALPAFSRWQAASEGRVLRERRVQADVMNQDGRRMEEKKATVSWSLAFESTLRNVLS